MIEGGRTRGRGNKSDHKCAHREGAWLGEGGRVLVTIRVSVGLVKLVGGLEGDGGLLEPYKRPVGCHLSSALIGSQGSRKVIFLDGRHHLIPLHVDAVVEVAHPNDGVAIIERLRSDMGQERRP